MKVYVVFDYDHVAHAGSNKANACRVCGGSNVVQVWINGKHEYSLQYSFRVNKWEKVKP